MNRKIAHLVEALGGQVGEGAQLCVEEATRFTNTLEHVIGEGSTSYTPSSSATAVAHSLLIARNESEFPRRLHRVFNELIGRPTSTFHLNLRNASPEDLGRYAVAVYRSEDPNAVFTAGASRSGLSILTYKFLRQTKYIDTVISLMAGGLSEFFETVVRTELSAAAVEDFGSSSSLDSGELRVLLDLPPRQSTDEVLSSAGAGVRDELAWSLLQVARHDLFSSCPALRTMPQPILPVALSLEYAEQAAAAFSRLSLDGAGRFDAVKRLLSQLREEGVGGLSAERRVRRGALLLEHAQALAPGLCLLNADITAWRALAGREFAEKAGVPRDDQLVADVLADLDRRSKAADAPLSEHYMLRTAIINGHYTRIIRLARKVRVSAPCEYPGHLHFFALWSLWASNVRHAEATSDERYWARAKRHWDQLWETFPQFCETELPAHEWFLERAASFALRYDRYSDVIRALADRSHRLASESNDELRAKACQILRILSRGLLSASG